VSVYYLSGPLFFAAARRLLETVEGQDGPDATLILSIRGVPLVDATGIEVLRELWHRQHAGGGDLLLTSMDQRVESQLQRGGLLDELGPSRLFWSADKAILSLGGKLGWETAVPDPHPTPARRQHPGHPNHRAICRPRGVVIS
jgi:SulP family sulfate permease